MSTTVDNRVVEMRFDNQQFERNANQSISTLDRLKQALKFDKSSAKGLSDLQKSTKDFKLDSISNSVNKLSDKFSALGIVGITALHRITNAALDAGQRITSALTIDPIKTGLEEYETKIGAIQVIRANDASASMSNISSALNELNTYADKTIYNFAQMTSNVGKFVAQGLGVAEAANAVKGMANLAAASGASASDMARATYQMSQALGGVIRKIDVNSLRNANMWTMTLKDTLIDIARAEGVAIDKMIEEKGTLEETLEEGWLTGQMFTKAMNIYSGVYSEAQLKAMGFNEMQIQKFQEIAKTAEEAAVQIKTFTQLIDTFKESLQSGWTQTWENVIGNFEEAQQLWTNVSQVLEKLTSSTAENRNAMLEEWKALGGRDYLILSISQAFKNLLDVIAPIKEAFDNIFPPLTGKRLAELTRQFRAFLISVRPTKDTLDALYYAATGVFETLKTGIALVKGIASALSPVASSLRNILNIALRFAGAIGYIVGVLAIYLRDSGTLNKVINQVARGFATVFDILSTGVHVLAEFVKAIADMPIVQQIFASVVNGLERLFNAFTTSLSSASGRFGGFIQNLKNIKKEDIAPYLTRIGSAFEAIWKALTPVRKGISDLIGIFEGKGNFVEKFNNGLSGLVESFKNFLKGGSIIEAGAKKFESLKQAGTNLASFESSFHDFVQKIVQRVGELELGRKIVMAFGVAVTWNILQIGRAIGQVPSMMKAGTKVLGELKNTIKSFNQSRDSAGDNMIKIAGAIAILAGSVFLLSRIPAENLKRCVVSLLALMGVFAILAGAAIAISSIDKIANNFEKASTGVVSIAASVGILALSLKVLDTIHPEKLRKNITAIGFLIADMLAVGLVMSRLDPASKANALVMVAFALSLYKAVEAVAKLAAFPQDQIRAAGDTVAQLMLLLTGLTLAVSKINFGAGAGLLAIVASLFLLEGALWAIAKLGIGADQVLENIDRFIVIFGALAGLLAMTRLAGKDALGAGVAAAGMGFALISMSAVLVVMAGLAALNPNALLVGVAGLIGMMGGIYIMMKAVSETKDASLKAAVALIPMSTALILMAGAVRILAGLGVTELAKGVAAVGFLSAFAAGLVYVSKFSEKANFKGILGMIAAVIAISGSLALLSFADPNGLMSATTALMLVLLSFAGSVAIISSTAKSINISGIASLVVMIGMLAAASTALYALSALPAEGLISASIALSVLIGALALAGSLADVGIKTALALTMLSVAIIPLALSLRLLEGIQWANIWQGLTAVIAALAILLGAGFVAGLGPVSIGLGVLVLTLMGFAAAALVFSQALTAITNALILFSQNGEMISASILNTFTSLGMGIQFVFQSIGTGLANMIISFFSTIAGAIGDGIDNIISTITGRQTDIVSTGTSLIGSLAQGIIAGLPGPVQAAISVVSAVGSAISGGGLFSTLFSAGADAVAGLASGIFSNSSTAEAAGAQLGVSTEQGLRNAVGWNSPWLDMIMGGIDACKGLANGILGGSSIPEAASAAMGVNVGNAGIDAAKNTMAARSGELNAMWNQMMAQFDFGALGGTHTDKSVEAQEGDWRRKNKENAKKAKENQDLLKSLGAGGGGGGGKSGGGGGGGGGGAAKEAAKETKKLFDVMKDGEKVVQKFAENFGEAYSQLGYTHPLQMGQEAVQKLAETIYAESVKSVDATEQAAKSQEDKLAEMRDAYIKFQDTVKTTISGAIDEFGKLEIKSSETVGEWMRNLNRQKASLGTWKNELIELAKRTKNYNLIDMAIQWGPEQTRRLQYMNALTDDQLKKLSTSVLETKDELIDITTNDVMAAAAYSVTSYETAAEETAESIEQTAEEVKNDTIETAEEAVQGYVVVNRDGVVQINQEQQRVIKGNEDISKSADKMAKYTDQALAKARSTYADFHDAVYNAVSSNFDIFEKFNTDTELTGDELLDNMESQVHGYQEWADGISTLIGRGLDEGLARKLVEAGEASYEKVQAMLEWSSDQLNTANSFYEQSLTLAEDLAKQIGQDMATAGLMATQGFVSGLNPEAGYQAAKEMAQKAVAGIVEAYETGGSAQVEQIGVTYSKTTGQSIEDNKDTVTNAAVKAMNDTVVVSKATAYDGGYETGGEYAKGVAAGIADGTADITSSADYMTDETTGEVEDNWMIQSPSKIGFRLGRFFDLGIAEGLTKNSKFISSAAETTSKSAIESMRAVVGHISDIINGEVQVDPTIRPVMDLSNVEAGASAIGSMFGGRAYTLSRGIGVRSQSDSINDLVSQMHAGSSQNVVGGSPINMYVYAAPGQSEEEIANIVEEKLMFRINRGRAVYDT